MSDQQREQHDAGRTMDLSKSLARIGIACKMLLLLLRRHTWVGDGWFARPMDVLHRHRLQGLVATIGGRWLVRRCSGEAPGVGAIATLAYAAVGRARIFEQDRAMAHVFKFMCLHGRFVVCRFSREPLWLQRIL